MRIAFTAEEVGIDNDEYSLACGVRGGDHSLILQRDAEDSDADWGIHLEYNDQLHSGYGHIRACRLGRTSLAIDLTQPLPGLDGVVGFDVTLRPANFVVEDALRRIFRGHDALLATATG